MLRVLEDVKQVEGDKNDPHVEAFVTAVEELHATVNQADKFLELLVKAKGNAFFDTLFKLFAPKVK